MIRTCPVCGTRNRVPASHLADTGRCGSCKSPLLPVSEPIEVNAEEFEEVAREAKVPVLADFWASWCGPCRMAEPEIRELARELAGKAVVLKVNTEAYPQLADRFGIQTIPYFVVLRNGQPVTQRTGVAPRAEMRRWLQV